jgi:hypothetical protein
VTAGAAASTITTIPSANLNICFPACASVIKLRDYMRSKEHS